VRARELVPQITTNQNLEPLPWNTPSLPKAGGKPAIKIIPATVGFSAHTLRGSLSSDSFHAADQVLAHRLRTGYLYEEIRLKGGAYGAFASPNGLEGVFTFATYRDPGLLGSLSAFRDSLSHAVSNPIAGRELLNTIIGTISNDLMPRSASEEAFLTLQRHQLNITDELRQLKRDTLLSLKPSDLNQAAKRLLAGFDQGTTYILTGRKIAEDAMAKAPLQFTLEE
jgi:Zn-dependent M16 (insulinase) family peptidase